MLPEPKQGKEEVEREIQAWNPRHVFRAQQFRKGGGERWWLRAEGPALRARQCVLSAATTKGLIKGETEPGLHRTKVPDVPPCTEHNTAGETVVKLWELWGGSLLLPAVRLRAGSVGPRQLGWCQLRSPRG